MKNGNVPTSCTFSKIDYFPYGKVVREYIAGDKERYLTTQHERDAETGLDYRGARYYDCEVARFLGLDPMQVERLSLNPYNYVSGNPIMRVDPTGRLDDKYTVDEDGTVTLQEKTDDDYDMLYTKSDWDNKIWDNGIQVKDQGILSGLAGYQNTGADGYGHTFRYADGNADDVFKVFKFVADNTRIEWGVYQGKSDGKPVNRITRFDSSPDYFERKRTPAALSVGMDDGTLTYMIHSHPGIDATRAEEIFSMGVAEDGEYKGDLAVSVIMRRTNKNLVYDVYFKNTKNLYTIVPNPTHAVYSKKIKSSTNFRYKK